MHVLESNVLVGFEMILIRKKTELAPLILLIVSNDVDDFVNVLV